MIYFFIIILMLLSGFFSASEIAYAASNKMRIGKLAQEGSLRAKWAKEIGDNYDRALCTILMGNNLVNIGATSTATVVSLMLVGEIGTAYAALFMTIIILIVGEIIPKQLAKKNADSIALLVSPVLYFLMVITKPLVFVILKLVSAISRLWGGKSKQAPITDDELVTIIENVEDEGVINENRSDLLQAAINFADMEAHEVITPRVDVTAVNVNNSLGQVLQNLKSSQYSRFPVYDDNIDNIIGILHMRNLLKVMVSGIKVTSDIPIDEKPPAIRSLLDKAYFIHKSKKLPDVLNDMRKNKTQIAIVIDDFGQTMGIITIEDIMEQVVGEIWDELDEIHEEIVKKAENLYEVGGSLSVHDFQDSLDIKGTPIESDSVTLGGWAIEMLGDFPRIGQSFSWENCVITVIETDDFRVTKLQIKVLPEKD
jgi:CBS domain containing-hemolysin-like protein